MARTEIETRTIRMIRRNGKTYEFGHVVEPRYTTGNGHTYAELHTFWARVHNGYEWRTLRHYVTEA